MTTIIHTNNKPPYNCKECNLEIKYTQKYKHIKRHTTIQTLTPSLIKSINDIKQEIIIIKKELEKYYLLINEKKKVILTLETAILYKKIIKSI